MSDGEVRSERQPGDFVASERRLEKKLGINHSQHHMQLSILAHMDWYSQSSELGIDRTRELAGDAVTGKGCEEDAE